MQQITKKDTARDADGDIIITIDNAVNYFFKNEKSAFLQAEYIEKKEYSSLIIKMQDKAAMRYGGHRRVFYGFEKMLKYSEESKDSFFSHLAKMNHILVHNFSIDPHSRKFDTALEILNYMQILSGRVSDNADAQKKRQFPDACRNNRFQKQLFIGLPGYNLHDTLDIINTNAKKIVENSFLQYEIKGKYINISDALK